MSFVSSSLSRVAAALILQGATPRKSVQSEPQDLLASSRRLHSGGALAGSARGRFEVFPEVRLVPVLRSTFAR